MEMSPPRFSDQTEREVKRRRLNWGPALDPAAVPTNPQFASEPVGLTITLVEVDGQSTVFDVGPGARGQTYLVRHWVTASDTGEVLELTHNGNPGAPLQITGHGRSGEDYRGSHRFTYG